MPGFVVPLSSRRARDARVAGGKGAGLARLLKSGFPVPAGFVITTAAFREPLSQAAARAGSPDLVLDPDLRSRSGRPRSGPPRLPRLADARPLAPLRPRRLPPPRRRARRRALFARRRGLRRGLLRRPARHRSRRRRRARPHRRRPARPGLCFRRPPLGLHEAIPGRDRNPAHRPPPRPPIRPPPCPPCRSPSSSSPWSAPRFRASPSAPTPSPARTMSSSRPSPAWAKTSSGAASGRTAIVSMRAATSPKSTPRSRPARFSPRPMSAPWRSSSGPSPRRPLPPRTSSGPGTRTASGSSNPGRSHRSRGAASTRAGSSPRWPRARPAARLVHEIPQHGQERPGPGLRRRPQGPRPRSHPAHRQDPFAGLHRHDPGRGVLRQDRFSRQLLRDALP